MGRSGDDSRPLLTIDLSLVALSEEFSKLAVLMKDLAPNLVILVKPSNKAAIARGQWPAVRQNLELILAGDPAAIPLF